MWFNKCFELSVFKLLIYVQGMSGPQMFKWLFQHLQTRTWTNKPMLKTRHLKHIGDKKMLLNNIQLRKANWKQTYSKKKSSWRHRLLKWKGCRTQLFNEYRNRSKYCKLNENAEDRKKVKKNFIAWTYGRNTYLIQV